MPWRALALHSVALTLYPGLVLTAGFGLGAEWMTATIIGRAGLRAAFVGLRRRLRQSVARAWPLVLATAILSALATAQLAAPLNPLSPLERNLLVAAVALCTASWLGWSWDWSMPAARAALVVQVSWLVALISPAIVAETLRPQVLGAAAVHAQLPLKALSGLLYIVCLPGLLRVAGEAPRVDVVGARTLLWLPLCGLGVSLFLPPAADDIGGVLRFLAGALAVALIAIGLGALLGRLFKSGARALHPRLTSALAAFVLAVAAVTSAIE